MYRQAVLKELWEELDSVVYLLQTDGWEKGPLSAQDHKEWGRQIGQAQGLAYAIAMVHNMSEPNIEWVRQEAMRRWEESLAEPTPIGSRRLAEVLRDRGWRDQLRDDCRHGRVVGRVSGGGRSRSRVPLGHVRRVAGK